MPEAGRRLTPHERTVRDWEDFVQTVSPFEQGSPFGERYAFRGHANAAWALRTSLMRALEGRGLDQRQALEIERNAMLEFQTQAHLHVPPAMAAPGGDAAQTWAVMQHYGAPTRLLDWTRSPYVACYFAVDQLEDDGAVWVMDSAALDRAMAVRHPACCPLPGDAAERAAVLLSADPAPVLYLAQLRLHTDRMAAQQLLFTISPAILQDHGALIDRALAGAPLEAWQKLVIPERLKAVFLRRLRTMNITARALFPGLDGVGRTIRELVRLEADRRPGEPTIRRAAAL